MRISDTALKEKTGKTAAQWFKFLDSIKATEKTHTEIAAYLCQKFGEDKAWYFQMITNGYEIARGLRKKHQKPDGYEISISKVIPASVEQVYNAWTDSKKRSQWLADHHLKIGTATKNKSLRITWVDDKTRLSVEFYAKDANKCQVVVQHQKLASAAQAERMKRYWKEQLEELKTYLTPV